VVAKNGGNRSPAGALLDWLGLARADSEGLEVFDRDGKKESHNQSQWRSLYESRSEPASRRACLSSA